MKDREILIGVSGGIAAYKSAALVSQLVQCGARVTVAMTEAATEFVGVATFAALTGRPVATGLFDAQLFPQGAHIALAQRAEFFCVAPASANFLGKAAHGIADDLLSTLYLCFAGPVLLAPAMNPDMWAKPAVQRNVAQLRTDGVLIIPPEEGWLSCRRTGPGRMADPDRIQEEIAQALAAVRRDS
ncbi:MAG: phosphopantothenoylcysteine decarboxylase [Planctomycetes bacterium]|nr:phosphopantothenoylcysteine decarboxylase [Planctomycetota bacterium]